MPPKEKKKKLLSVVDNQSSTRNDLRLNSVARALCLTNTVWTATVMADRILCTCSASYLEHVVNSVFTFCPSASPPSHDPGHVFRVARLCTECSWKAPLYTLRHFWVKQTAFLLGVFIHYLWNYLHSCEIAVLPLAPSTNKLFIRQIYVVHHTLLTLDNSLFYDFP